MRVQGYNIDANPLTSTSPSAYTVTVSSKPGESPTTISSAKPAENTPQANWKNTSVVTEDYSTSGARMKRRMEHGLPNQALTLFAPVGMAEDLTKVVLILCKEVKAEIQSVKKSITAIPLKEMQKSITEATLMREERMNNLEDQYSKLREIVIH